MAKMYGKASSYLISSDKLDRFASLSYILIFVLILFVAIVKNFHNLSTVVGIIAVAILFGPFAWYAYRKANEHITIANKFRRGRRGEGAIWYELRKLSDDYLVFQDVKIGKSGNIDFVVLNSGGLYTIEVKSQSGKIDYNGEELTINNWPIKGKSFLKQAMAEALVLHNDLNDKLGKDIFVHPIIVFSNSEAKLRFGLKPVKNVFVVQRRLLRKLLELKKENYSPDLISRIENELKTLVVE